MCGENTVYLLCHEYVMESGEEESKDLGTYSMRQKAEEAIERYRGLPGFRDHPDGFAIYISILDRDEAWTDGFVTMK